MEGSRRNLLGSMGRDFRKGLERWLSSINIFFLSIARLCTFPIAIVMGCFAVECIYSCIIHRKDLMFLLAAKET